AWGVRFFLNDCGAILINPGVAFSAGGVRLSIDSPPILNLPTGPGPWRVLLRASEVDRESLRVAEQPTLINLVTTPLVEPDDESQIGPDALIIGKVQLADSKPELLQDPAIFSVTGNHSHSG